MCRPGTAPCLGWTLTELAGTHVLQHGVCFHFVVTWRADGRVTWGGKKGGQVSQEGRRNMGCDSGPSRRRRVFTWERLASAARRGRVDVSKRPLFISKREGDSLRRGKKRFNAPIFMIYPANLYINTRPDPICSAFWGSYAPVT